jgi:hypothetical protein
MGGKSGGEVIIVVLVDPSQYRCVDSPVSDILHLVGRAGAPAENPPRRHADRLNIEPRAITPPEPANGPAARTRVRARGPAPARIYNASRRVVTMQLAEPAHRPVAVGSEGMNYNNQHDEPIVRGGLQLCTGPLRIRWRIRGDTPEGHEGMDTRMCQQ